MKRLILLLCLACVQCGPIPAVAIELVGNKVVLTPGERQMMDTCATQGGCLIITVRALEATVDQTIAMTVSKLAEAGPICRRLTT